MTTTHREMLFLAVNANMHSPDLYLRLWLVLPRVGLTNTAMESSPATLATLHTHFLL